MRRQLEKYFGIDLSDRKAFIREQVGLFLQSEHEQADEPEQEDGLKEPEEEEGEEGQNDDDSEESDGSNSKKEMVDDEEEEEEEEKKIKKLVRNGINKGRLVHD